MNGIDCIICSELIISRRLRQLETIGLQMHFNGVNRQLIFIEYIITLDQKALIFHLVCCVMENVLHMFELDKIVNLCSRIAIYFVVFTSSAALLLLPPHCPFHIFFHIPILLL